MCMRVCCSAEIENLENMQNHTLSRVGGEWGERRGEEGSFSTESVSPVFSTSEKYICYTHKTFISVISKCLKQATLK